MSNDKLHVETRYITGKDTSTPEKYIETEQKTIEIEKYGSGKPWRKIIRVRIAHGKGSNRV